MPRARGLRAERTVARCAGALCIGAGGHVLASVGGNVPAVCGTVVVTDVNVLDGPTAGTGPGTAAADCPYPGWSTEVHDPFIATETGVHYLFSTAPGIPIRRSTDLRTWEPVGRVFRRTCRRGRRR